MDITFTKIKKNLLVFFLLLSTICLKAETNETWYANAQQRIDTLRKGNFAIKVVDKNGQPFTGNVSVKMTKHEFPFGISFDLYEGAVSNGNSYTTSNNITASSDAEIYQTERWYSLISYAIPVEKNKEYKITLKFAEIYFSSPDSRIFNVIVEGNKFLSNYDVFAEAGGRDIAKDTSLLVTAVDTIITIEFVAIKDNASIKGMEIENLEDQTITRINCGGPALTTASGNSYVSDENFFDLNASRVPSEEQWMKATMQKYFNYGVSGNSFKWSGIQPQHTAPNYKNFDNAVNFAQSVGWELRAHTLLWGGNDDHSMPGWVRNLPTPQAITDTCKMRITREMTRYKGIIKEYDVINEPLTNHADWLRKTVGDSILWNCFKWAHAADPDAKLYINDYNVEYNWGQAVEYRDLILKIKAMGGPISGVGVQAHFWDCCRPNVDELVNNLNIIAEAGLPIRLTEYDWGTNLTEKQQVEDFVKVATVAFSHPSVNGMISWGLSDKGAWRANTGYFDANHRPKLAADTLLYYTKKLWATNFDSISNGDQINFNAYYGNYNIEVDFDGVVKYFTIPCTKANNDSVFVLNEQDAIVKGPQYVSTQLISENSLRISFDKKIDPNSINKGDFKFFTNNALRIQGAKIAENDSTTLILDLQNLVSPNDYLAVSYFPGSLVSTDGGKAQAFGPQTVINLASGLISASVINDGNTIEAVFNRKVKNIDQNLSSFSLLVNGQSVVASGLEYGSDSSKILLNLSQKLVSSDKSTIKYSKGSLQAVNGFDFQTSADIKVTNLWPKLVSSEIIATGSKLALLFNTLLENVNINNETFEVLVDGQPVEITGLTMSGKDSSKIVFTILGKIAKSQKVLISYIPGTVKAFNGNSLAEFKNVIVKNNSTVTSIEQFEQNRYKVFPNPASENININNEAEIQFIKIINSQGLEVYNSGLKPKISTLSVSNYPRGIYMVQFIDNNGKIFTDKLILK